MANSNEQTSVGAYKILNKIGEGGMALIYKAVQPSLKRNVVIKKLKDPNREIINRFKKEALLSASFHQENLVSIYDFIYINRSYNLVMEYVDGEDLRTIADFMAPLPATVAGLIILGIARGLEYTHARNIIHRDIKPSNILVSYDGDVKLIDFGVAKDDMSTRLTMTGMIVGTPAYMAPEQANGEPLSARSDLFAVGILLYELLTGMKPFFGENNTEILTKIIRNKYVPPGKINPDIPPRFRKIIKKAIHRDPQSRYQSATQLINDLEHAIPLHARSIRKSVIGRYLKKLDKTGDGSSTDSIRIQAFAAIPSSGWRIFRYALTSVIVFMLFFQGIRFHQNQLGYVQVAVDKTGYSLKIDGRDEQSLDSDSTVFGPLLKGKHELQVFDRQSAGLFRAVFNITEADTVRIKPILPQSKDSSRVFFLSQPNAANVFIDGKLKGKTPLQGTAFSPGEHLVQLKKPGFRDGMDKIVLNSGQIYTLQYLLSPSQK